MEEIEYKCKFPKMVDLFVNSNRNCSIRYMNEIMRDVWNEDPNIFLKMLCFIRDPRTGKGERDLGYYMLKFLKDNFPKTYEKNIKKIVVEYGCFRDLLIMARYKMRDDFTDVELEIYADILKSDLLLDDPTLAVKWAPRERNKFNDLAKKLSLILFPGEKKSLELYRTKILNPLSKKIEIVEQKMTKGEWNNVNYETVPLCAIQKYGKPNVINKDVLMEGSFLRNDYDKFTTYLDKNKNKNKKKNNNKKPGFQKIIDNILLFGINDNNMKAIILTLSKYDVKVSKYDIDQKLNYALIDESILDDDQFVNSDELVQNLDKETFLEDESLMDKLNVDEETEWDIM